MKTMDHFLFCLNVIFSIKAKKFLFQFHLYFSKAFHSRQSTDGKFYPNQLKFEFLFLLYQKKSKFLPEEILTVALSLDFSLNLEVYREFLSNIH
mmetsp:Transcript_48214/g.117134  ORF Transcript_48214/g.117134 Transcript_48214/m.117134 type:complete len:94 (-) Transcript_48214:5153-5434(-)